MIQFNIMGLRHALETRDSRLYSIREMADHTNLSQDTISNIVRNKRAILDVRTFSKLVPYFQRNGLTICLGDFFRWGSEGLVSNIAFLITQLNPIPRYDNIAQETGIELDQARIR